MAITFLAIALPLSALLYYTTAPLYVSQALISVEPSALSQIPFMREPPRADTIANHLILLKSRSLSDAVIEVLPRETFAELLAKPQHFGYYWLRVKNTITGWFGQPPTILTPQEQAVAELREARMDFVPSREARNAFFISATATNPRVAVDLVNAHIQVLLSRSRKDDNEDAKKTRDFLEVQYQQVKDSVARGEEAIAKLQQQKGRRGGQSEMELVRLAQLENALADTQANRQVLANRIASLRSALDQARSAEDAKGSTDKTGKGTQKDEGAAAASEAAEYQARTAAFKAAQDQLTRLESKLASLQARYTEAHPQVQLTHDEIARQQARVTQLARELPADPRPTRITSAGPATPIAPSERVQLQNQLTAFDKESDALVAKEEALKIQVARLRGEIRSLSQDDLEFANLRRSVESNRNLLAVLSDRLMAARIREQGDSSVIRIIDPASVPLKTSATRAQRLLLAALAFAGCVAFGSAFAVEYWRQPVETEEDIAKNTGLTVLGSVGVMEHAASAAHKRRSGTPILLSTSSASVRTPHNSPIHVELYRAMRANIETERLKSSFRSILVTSASPHEGKSTTILNLAHSFNEFGRRVLIVEADLRRPSLSSPLALTTKPGLVDFLSGTATFEQVCRRLPSGVSIIPGQVARGDVASLLASARFKELLHAASAEFDLILVDSAPVLAVPDNLLLGNVVDRIVIVAKATSTSVRDLRRARAVVERSGGRLLGVVLNQANPRDVPYYHPRYRKYYPSTPAESSKKSSGRTPLSPQNDGTRNSRGVAGRETVTEREL
jgi:capsular exopolysaccharide synthesis family protein